MKNSHLSLDQRIEIQECLSHGMTFKAIAKRIKKDQTTVSKEVKKHARLNPTTVVKSKPESCPVLMKPPFVCNGCKRKRTECAFDKRLYYAKYANEEYRKTLVDCREGVHLNQASFYEIDKIISDNVKKGQRIYHILKTQELDISKSAVYRHVKNGQMSIGPMDLPRSPKFKIRKEKKQESIPKKIKIGRTYDDFLVYKAEHSISTWVEMDTVIGRVGGKVIVTFDFTFCNFMFGLLIDDKCSNSVTSAILKLKTALQEYGLSFGDVFPVILTDNGGEFSNVLAIENSLINELETRLFFCDPYQSSQKPHVEKNHTLFRDIAPKGTSFDDWTQDTVNLVFCHVNGVKRNVFKGKSPYEMFIFTFGQATADVLGVHYVDPKDVIQSPKLLKN